VRSGALLIATPAAIVQTARRIVSLGHHQNRIQSGRVYCSGRNRPPIIERRSKTESFAKERKRTENCVVIITKFTTVASCSRLAPQYGVESEQNDLSLASQSCPLVPVPCLANSSSSSCRRKCSGQVLVGGRSRLSVDAQNGHHL
jgi:hypothetical protein